MQILKKMKLAVAVVATIGSGIVGVLSLPAAAASNSSVNCGGDFVYNATLKTCQPKDGATVDLWTTISQIINWILAIVGVIAVFMIILGGIQYSTSAGDPGKVKKAKDTILYGIIGLVIALLAMAIVNFVLVNVFA